MKIKSTILAVMSLSFLGITSSYAAVSLTADFSVANKGIYGSSTAGATQDTTGMNWTISGDFSGITADTTTNEFRTVGGAFRIQDPGSQMKLTTSGLTVGVGTVTVDFGNIAVLGAGANTTGEFLRVFYSINGGTEVTSDATAGGSKSFSFAALEGDVIRAGFEVNANGAGDGYTIPQVIISGASPIPEPSTALLGALGALMLLRRRR